MWLEEIFKGGAEGLFSGLKGLIGTVKADPLEVMRIQAAIQQAEMQLAMALSQAQNKVNEIEAGSTNLWIAGWRPFAGWVAGSAFAYSAILEPLVRFVSVVGFGYAGAFPVLDTNLTIQVLLGMLGLAGLRTYEKQAGVSK